MTDNTTQVPNSVITFVVDKGRIIIPIMAVVWFAAEILIAASAYELDYDEGVYLQTAFQHAQGQSLYGQLFVSQPPLLLELLTLSVIVFGNTVLVPRLIILLFTAALLLGIYLTARELVGRSAATIALYLSFLFSPLFLQANVVQSDIPSVALGVFAVFSMIRFNRSRRLLWLIGSAALFAIALGFKILVPFYGFVLLYLMLVRLNPTPDTGRRTEPVVRTGLTLALFAVATGLFLFLQIIPFPLSPFLNQVWSLGSSGVFGHVATSGSAGHLRDIFYQWVLLNPLVLALAAYAVFQLLSKKRSTALLLIIWGGTQLIYFVLMRHWLWPHHVIAFFPVVMICASEAVVSLLFAPRQQYAANNRARLKIAVAALLLAVVLIPNLIYSSITLHKVLDPGQRALGAKIVGIVRKNSGPGDICITDDQMTSFRAARLTFPTLVDTSWKRVRTGSLREETLLQAAGSAHLVILLSDRLQRFQKWRSFVEENYREIFDSDRGLVFVRSKRKDLGNLPIENDRGLRDPRPFSSESAVPDE